MDFEVHCMFILPTELSLFNCDKVNSVLQSSAPLTKGIKVNNERITTVTFITKRSML